MLCFLGGNLRALCDGCWRFIEGDPSFAVYMLPNGEEGHVCSRECGARFMERPPPKYRCPNCVHKRAEVCEHQAAAVLA